MATSNNSIAFKKFTVEVMGIPRWSVARISQVRCLTLWTMDSNHKWIFILQSILQNNERELRIIHENYKLFARTTNKSTNLFMRTTNYARKLRIMHENYKLFYQLFYWTDHDIWSLKFLVSQKVSIIMLTKFWNLKDRRCRSCCGAKSGGATTGGCAKSGNPPPS